MSAPGCERCRKDIIRFVRDVALPRFTMRAGEKWSALQRRYTPALGYELGGGFAPSGSFVIESRNHHRACGCPCRKQS